MDTYHAEVKIKEQRITLEIYDTAGQEDFTQIRTLVYPSTNVFIMCYSCVFGPSLTNIQKFWHPETDKVKPETPIILVGNKLDLAAEQPQEYIKAETAEKILSAISGKAALQCSAQMEAFGRPGNVDKVFKTAIKVGLEDLNPKVPPKETCGCELL